MEAWFNIMDRGFNLHLKDNELARTRLVGADEVLVAQLLSATGEEALRLELPASLADAAEALI
jgi:putative heme degradation protein